MGVVVIAFHTKWWTLSNLTTVSLISVNSLVNDERCKSLRFSGLIAANKIVSQKLAYCKYKDLKQYLNAVNSLYSRTTNTDVPQAEAAVTAEQRNY